MASPGAKTIESTLRGIIRDLFRASDFDNLTVKRVRQRAEERLGLESGWFKGNDEWRERSSDFIQTEVARQEQKRLEPSEPKISPQKSAKSKGVKSTVQRGQKRSSVDSSSSKLTKKQKIEDNSDAESLKKVILARPPPQAMKRNKLKVIVDSDDEENASEQADENAASPNRKEQIEPIEESNVEELKSDAELSSLSSLLDDTPPPKSKLKSKTSSKPPKSKPKPKPKKESMPKESLNKEDEIKTLQSWLLKCGIRKKWNQVLAPYKTPREKITYLKDMLREIGMEGRYSASKAKQIKEERELRAELEAVTDFDKDWGVSATRRRGAKKTYVVEDDGESEVEVSLKKAKEYDFADEESD